MARLFKPESIDRSTVRADAHRRHTAGMSSDRQLQHDYAAAVRITRACFQFIGVPILNTHGWHCGRFLLFSVLLAAPIVNGAIAAARALPAGDQRVYATCIYVIFPNLMVQVKLLICVCKWRDINALMAWVRGCFEQRFADAQVQRLWEEIAAAGARKAILYTR